MNQRIRNEKLTSYRMDRLAGRRARYNQGYFARLNELECLRDGVESGEDIKIGSDRTQRTHIDAGFTPHDDTS